MSVGKASELGTLALPACGIRPLLSCHPKRRIRGCRASPCRQQRRRGLTGLARRGRFCRSCGRGAGGQAGRQELVEPCCARCMLARHVRASASCRASAPPTTCRLRRNSGGPCRLASPKRSSRWSARASAAARLSRRTRRAAATAARVFLARASSAARTSSNQGCARAARQDGRWEGSRHSSWDSRSRPGGSSCGATCRQGRAAGLRWKPAAVCKPDGCGGV